MRTLDREQVIDSFALMLSEAFNPAQELSQRLKTQSFVKMNSLILRSGNYDGSDIVTFAKEIID
jgi:UDP-N-acetylmuramate: L-alanyl-gamma-D-glutamyl-meso-diaminopimelate ligase